MHLTEIDYEFILLQPEFPPKERKKEYQKKRFFLACAFAMYRRTRDNQQATHAQDAMLKFVENDNWIEVLHTAFVLCRRQCEILRERGGGGKRGDEGERRGIGGKGERGR